MHNVYSSQLRYDCVYCVQCIMYIVLSNVMIVSIASSAARSSWWWLLIIPVIMAFIAILATIQALCHLSTRKGKVRYKPHLCNVIVYTIRHVAALQQISLRWFPGHPLDIY